VRNGSDGRVDRRRAVGNLDFENDSRRAAHHVLHRRERCALGTELLLGRSGVRVRIEMAAGVHHHAELRKQQRERQHMHEPAAIASDQKSLREGVFPEFELSTRSAGRKLHAS
jgi:hypothetical protein